MIKRSWALRLLSLSLLVHLSTRFGCNKTNVTITTRYIGLWRYLNDLPDLLLPLRVVSTSKPRVSKSFGINLYKYSSSQVSIFGGKFELNAHIWELWWCTRVSLSHVTRRTDGYMNSARKARSRVLRLLPRPSSVPPTSSIFGTFPHCGC